MKNENFFNRWVSLLLNLSSTLPVLVLADLFFEVGPPETDWKFVCVFPPPSPSSPCFGFVNSLVNLGSRRRQCRSR